jgi:Ferritin-like
VSIPVVPIDTLESLREHLQWAIELEHATLPPYLCALYSLDPARNPDAVNVLESVFVEEMLHMALAANVLNAVGGQPQLDSPRLLAPYPRCLPHSSQSVELSLGPFDAEAIELFMAIEKPALPDSVPEGDEYETIGQFYDAIEQGLRDLCAELGEDTVFCGDPARQVTKTTFHYTAGRLVAVDSLATALAALEEIVEEGEGTSRGEVWDGEEDVFHPHREEVAHYYRFVELKVGRSYQRGDTPQSGPTGEAFAVDLDGARPMRRNPRLSDHPAGHPTRTAQEEFNETYCGILALLEGAFNGESDMIGPAIQGMFALRAQAIALMEMPDGDGTTAGPTFEYVDPELRR